MKLKKLCYFLAPIITTCSIMPVATACRQTTDEDITKITMEGDDTQSLLPPVEPSRTVKYKAISDISTDVTEKCNWEITQYSEEIVQQEGWATINNEEGHKGEITFTNARINNSTWIKVKASLIGNSDIFIEKTISIKIVSFDEFKITGNPQIESIGVPVTAEYKAMVSDIFNITSYCYWTSDNESIATIDSDGKATFTGNIGEVTFTAKYKGDDKFATLTVPVVPLGVNFVDDSETVKNVEIDSQQAGFDYEEKKLEENCYTTYTFKTTDETLTTENLTALVQVDEGTKIDINPKVYVEVKDKIITAKVTYDPSKVENINDTVKFHITFANTQSGHTWAQTIDDLSITYKSAFLDKDFEYLGYLFTGQNTGTRNFELTVADERITSADQITVSVQHTTGSIILSDPTFTFNSTTKKLVVSIPYTSSTASVGDKIGIQLDIKYTIENEIKTETFYMVLWASDELYLIDNKLTITNGGDFTWGYWYMALPLGTKETIDDITVTITNQTYGENSPMHIEIHAKQLDAENNYLSLIFKITEGYVDPVNIDHTDFTVKLSKPDTRTTKGYSDEEGSAGWDQENTLTLTYDKANGEYLTINKETPEESQYTVSEATDIEFCDNFTASKKSIAVLDFDWEFEFELDNSSLPTELQSEGYYCNQFMYYKSYDPYGRNDLYYTITTRATSNLPANVKTYISEHGSMDVKFNVKYIARRKITTSIGITRYQKQIFTQKDHIWLTFK